MVILKRYNVEKIVDDESLVDGLVADGWAILEDEKPKKKRTRKEKNDEEEDT